VSLVPPSPALRRQVLDEARLSYWYSKAGYEIEKNEYGIRPEDFWRERSLPVLSLEKLIEEDEERGDVTETRIAPLVSEAEHSPRDTEYFVDQVCEVAGLTPGEADAVAWVASGNPLLGEWAVRLGEALGMGRNAARMSWSRAKTKLRKTWAVEPPKRKHDPLRREIRGAGASHWRAYPNPQHAFRPRFETWTDHE
jgi:hypothetical protein